MIYELNIDIAKEWRNDSILYIAVFSFQSFTLSDMQSTLYIAGLYPGQRGSDQPVHLAK